MERLTGRKNGVFVYAGPDRFSFDGMTSPAQIAIRNVQAILERLAAYEDSGLTPEEVLELAKIVRCKDCKHYKNQPSAIAMRLIKMVRQYSFAKTTFAVTARRKENNKC